MKVNILDWETTEEYKAFKAGFEEGFKAGVKAVDEQMTRAIKELPNGCLYTVESRPFDVLDQKFVLAVQTAYAAEKLRKAPVYDKDAVNISEKYDECASCNFRGYKDVCDNKCIVPIKHLLEKRKDASEVQK